MTIVGSGVMVAPGMVLTATHVIDEIEAAGETPVLLSFLPDAARAWLPIGFSTLSSPSAFYHDVTVSSDITLISCSLNSDALEAAPCLSPRCASPCHCSATAYGRSDFGIRISKAARPTSAP